MQRSHTISWNIDAWTKNFGPTFAEDILNFLLGHNELGPGVRFTNGFSSAAI